MGNLIWERERVKLETLELVGAKIIGLMNAGIEVPVELIEWVQGRIDWQEGVVKGVKG
jgi:hypothetical protein